MQFFRRLKPNSQGILCLIGALVFLTFSDSIIKWLSPKYALHQIMLYRACFAMVLVLIFVKLEGGLALLATKRPLLHLFRGMLLVFANMFFFLGLSVMAFAEVVALFFTAPLFICLLAQPILGEKVGAIRWCAIVLGLVGVVVMVRPESNQISWSNFLPILAALTYAVMQMVTRKLGMRDSAGALTFYIQIAFILVSSLSGLIIGSGQYDQFDQSALEFLFRAWTWPALNDLGLMALCGMIVAFGGYLLSQSYRLAQASVVAPFEYTSLPLAVLIGYLIWQELPTLNDIFGSLLIIGSGLIVVVFESKRS